MSSSVARKVSNLPRLPAVRDLINMYNLTARSQLSQNFILDKNITDKIVRSSGVSYKDDLVLEVGPGPGLLTRSLLDAGANRLVAVEKDARFLPTLDQLSEASEGRFRVLHGDMLTTRADDLAIPFSKSHPVDKARKPKALHVVGNLPFGVATPLLLSWLHALRETDDLFVLAPPGSLTLMFQKEVAKRIVSPIKCKERGRLSVMTQAVCHARISYNVPARIFVPAPDVDAAVVHLVPRGDGPEKILHGSYTLLEDLVRYCFSKRRKTLGHTLKPIGARCLEILDEVGLDRVMRPEEVGTEEWCRLSDRLGEAGIHIPLPAEGRVRKEAREHLAIPLPDPISV